MHIKYILFGAAFFIIKVGYANDYSDAQSFAEEKLKAGRAIITTANPNTIPLADKNPEESKYLPVNKGELEKKGEEYGEVNAKAIYLKNKADETKDDRLNTDEKKSAENSYETAKSEDKNVGCSSGDCVKTKPEKSDDFNDGVIQIGALSDSAKAVAKNQTSTGEAGLFKGSDITCRIVYKANRVNFCKKDKDIISGTAGEKALHKAQLEGRAIKVNGDYYCSKRKKILFKNRCVERRQSWCVFESKLAKIIQLEGRRQLGFSFGSVYGDTNSANCRGISPLELSKIHFDSNEMKKALSELTAQYRSKMNSPSSGALSRKAQEDVIAKQRGGHA